MAWTNPPRTWSDGELVTAAIMNPHVRDQLKVTTHNMAFKSADQSVTSSTALVNDTHLTFSIGTNETWSGQFCLMMTGNAAGDFKMALNAPASSTGWFAGAGNDVAGTGSQWNGFTSFGDANTLSFGATTAGIFVHINWYIATAGTSGTFVLRWAQDTSNGTATTLKAGSYMVGARLN